MNSEEIKDVCKYSNDEEDGPEFKTIFCLIETHVQNNSSQVLYMSHNPDNCRCYLLDHLNDIEEGDLQRQICVEKDETFNLFVRGFFFGKTLDRVYRICEYEY